MEMHIARAGTKKAGEWIPCNAGERYCRTDGPHIDQWELELLRRMHGQITGVKTTALSRFYWPLVQQMRSLLEDKQTDTRTFQSVVNQATPKELAKLREKLASKRELTEEETREVYAEQLQEAAAFQDHMNRLLSGDPEALVVDPVKWLEEVVASDPRLASAVVVAKRGPERIVKDTSADTGAKQLARVTHFESDDDNILDLVAYAGNKQYDLVYPFERTVTYNDKLVYQEVLDYISKRNKTWVAGRRESVYGDVEKTTLRVARRFFKAPALRSTIRNAQQLRAWATIEVHSIEHWLRVASAKGDPDLQDIDDVISTYRAKAEAAGVQRFLNL